MVFCKSARQQVDDLDRRTKYYLSWIEPENEEDRSIEESTLNSSYILRRLLTLVAMALIGRFYGG